MPELVEHEEHGRSVGRSAAQSAADRQALLEREVGAERGAGLLLEQARGAQAEVLLAERTFEAQPAVVARRDTDAILSVDQAEDRLQLVIAVGALAEDVEEEVELRRGRKPIHRAALAHPLTRGS